MQREEMIGPYVEGKDVLDVGSIGQTAAYCLWDFLKQKAGHLTGIDVVDAPASVAAEFGLSKEQLPRDVSIIRGDMETYQFGRQFDVVTACDVIEHVENQGLFLRNIRRHLRPGGHLILTTPNAKWLTVAFRPNPSHTL